MNQKISCLENKNKAQDFQLEEVQLAAKESTMTQAKESTMTQDETEEKNLATVKQNPYAIKFIDNPSEKVQLAAVNQDGLAIEFIKNPSEEVQLAAVKQNGYAIQHIKNPSEAVKLAAVKKYGYAIEYIENPSENVQLAAVKQNGYAIEYIKNPSEAVKLAAVNNNGCAIQYIKNPSEAVRLTAVNKNGYAIQYIDNPSEEVKLAAVNKYGYAIEYIANPSEDVKLAAYKQINPQSKESTMNKISSTIKDRSINATYRIASKNLIKGIKSAIIKSLSKNDNTNIEMLSAFLETEYGDGLLLSLIGFGLPLAMDNLNIPGLKGSAHLQKLSEEMQTEAMATVGDSLLKEIMGTLLPVITQALSVLPSEEKFRAIEDNTAEHVESTSEILNFAKK